jgi:hypothetical protein
MNQSASLLEKKPNCFFDINERPVYVDNRIVPDKRAIINKDTGQVIGIVGKNYVPVPNRQLLDDFCSILQESEIDFEILNTHLIRGGSKTIVEILFPLLKVDVQAGDKLQLKGYLINSFDGFSSAILEFGFIRLVCKNGMVVGKKEMIISARHVGRIDEKIVKGFKLYIEEKEREVKAFTKQLMEFKFEKKKGFEIIEKSKWIAKKYHGDLIKRYEEEFANLGSLDAWGLYNVFTFVITNKMQVNVETRMALYKKLNKETKNWQSLEAAKDR